MRILALLPAMGERQSEVSRMMTDMKPLVCANCGGQIDRSTMKCPFCDTQYHRQRDNAVIHYIVDRPGVHRLRATIRVDDQMARHDPGAASEYVLNRLRHEIADGLLAYMKIETAKDFDPLSRCQIIRGEVRVLDPYFDY